MRILRQLVLACASAGVLYAQRPDQLTRTTAATGLNDSALVVVCDSVTPTCRIRAGSVAELRKAIGNAPVTHATLADTVTLGGRDSLTLGSTKMRSGKRLILVADTVIGQLNLHDTLSCVSGCVIVGQPTYGTLQQHLKADSASFADTLLLGARNGATATTQAAHDSSTKLATDLYADRAAYTAATTQKAANSSLADTVVLGARNGATATTQAAKDSSTKIATTRYVDVAVAAGGASFPLKAPSGTAGAPSYAFSNTTDTIGVYRIGTDTLGFSTQGVASIAMAGGGNPTIIGKGGGGNFNISAGTGANVNLTFFASNGSGVAQQFLNGTGASGHPQALFANGLASAPSISLANSSTTGFYRYGADTIGISNAGSAKWIVVGSEFATLTNSPGCGAPQLGVIKATPNTGIAFDSTSAGNGVSLCVNGTQALLVASNQLKNRAGSAAAPSYSFASGTGDGPYLIANDSVGVASGGAEQMAIGPSGYFNLPNLPSEGSTKNAICWDGSTHTVTQNAAATCTVSSQRYKTNIKPLALDSAYNTVLKLDAVTFNERENGRPSQHVIAEKADSLSSRITFYDNQGRPNSVDDGAILAALLRVIQDQTIRIGDLEKFKTTVCKNQPSICQ